jgi:hypothetical protein
MIELMSAQQEIERLRAALQAMVAQIPDHGTEADISSAAWRMVEIARRALEGKD